MQVELSLRLFDLPDRDSAKSLWRRAERAAGAINPFLIVMAIGLALIDLLYAGQLVAAALPPAVMAAGCSP
jgi:hypothetical protein